MLTAIGNIENPGNSLNQLTSELENLMAQKATGRLIIRKQRTLAEIYLFLGRQQYIVDRRHRVRRWQRAVEQYCPNWSVPTPDSQEPLWEYELLSQGIGQKQLTLTQVKAVLKGITKECLLEIGQQSSIEIQWKPHNKSKSTLSYCLTLSPAEINLILHQVKEIEHEWNGAGLTHINPNLTPHTTKLLESHSLSIPHKYLNGQFTFWDIAQALNKSVVDVASSLQPWIDKNVVHLREIQDLLTSNINTLQPVSHTRGEIKAKDTFPPTIMNTRGEIKAKDTFPPTAFSAFTSHESSSMDSNDQTSIPPDISPLARIMGKKAVIACIDDSPVVTHNLKQLLTPMGYQVLTIQEPMAGFAKLIKYQPDAILLDLNMPNADGYSVCKFLRDTPVFCETPIIILTSQDTMIDRTRAKLAGATDFLAKPPKAKELLQMLSNLLIN